LGDVIGRQVDVQRVPVAVDSTPEVRLDAVIEREPAELLAVVDEEAHTVHEIGVDATLRAGGSAERDRLSRLSQVVVERAGAGPVAAEVVGDGEVERGSERAGEVGANLTDDVAGVRPNNLSRGNDDRGELLRLDVEQVQAEAGLRLALPLTDPVRGRLT